MMKPSRRSALRALGAVALALALVAPVALPGTTATAEEEAKGQGRWVLGLEHGHLRTVLLPRAGGRSTAYNYMRMDVTNGTAHARPWHPLVLAITDTKDKAGKDSEYVAIGHDEALTAIRRREGDASLEPITKSAGKKIPAGTTLKTVAIFGPLDQLYDRIDIQVHGLADSIATYKVDVYDGTEVAKDEAITADKGWVIGDSAYWHRNQKILGRLLAQAKADGDGILPAPIIQYVVVSERRYYDMVFERLGDEFRPEDDLITAVSEGWKVDGDPKMLRIVNAK